MRRAPNDQPPELTLRVDALNEAAKISVTVVWTGGIDRLRAYAHVMDHVATPPEPPYTAVIFTSTRTEGDQGYAAMAARMEELAREQPGYLGLDSVHDGAAGITVSYWADDAAAAAWKQVHEHLLAQERGRSTWYSEYRVQVATVTRAYGPDHGDVRVTSDTGEKAGTRD